jgi:hypothetical protein
MSQKDLTNKTESILDSSRIEILKRIHRTPRSPEPLTKEDVRELYKSYILYEMNRRISDDELYDTTQTLDAISETLNFSSNEDGVVTIPSELKWIEDVLNEPMDDYPVLCWKSEIEKHKGKTLEQFFWKEINENYMFDN